MSNNNRGPTTCPGRGPEAGAIDPSEGRIIDPVTLQPVQRQQQQQQRFDIDAGGCEPECDAQPMHPQRQNPPPVYPVTGNPVPTEAQKNAQRPPSFNDDLQKLIVMGFSRDKAENALLAADFNLGQAIRKLQGR